MTNKPLLNNRYRLEKPLGRGGMAIVYSGTDLMLERPVGIKVLRKDYSQDPAFRERFRQEAKAAANLSHPNLVTIYDFGLDANHLFIVMELIPGTNLKALIRSRGTFTQDEAIPLIVQACKGIGYAHRAGLVHCDVKPQNMLITPDNRLKVADFGIARALASIESDEKSDTVWGSPQYFSPEQASGHAPSPASDVYGIGVMMYEMLCGRLPFEGDSGVELAVLHQEAPPIPPREINDDIPDSLNEIILKVLSKEPSARYRTADQLGRVLLRYAEHQLVEEEIFTEPLREVAVGENEYLLDEMVVDEEPNQENGDIVPSGFIDWVTVGLGMLAFIMAGGLIPLWIWVYLEYNPPVP